MLMEMIYIYNDIYIYNTGWWLTYPSEKYEFVSWDYEYFSNIWKTHVPKHQAVLFICFQDVFSYCRFTRMARKEQPLGWVSWSDGEIHIYPLLLNMAHRYFVNLPNLKMVMFHCKLLVYKKKHHLQKNHHHFPLVTRKSHAPIFRPVIAGEG